MVLDTSKYMRKKSDGTIEVVDFKYINSFDSTYTITMQVEGAGPYFLSFYQVTDVTIRNVKGSIIIENFIIIDHINDGNKYRYEFVDNKNGLIHFFFNKFSISDNG